MINIFVPEKISALGIASALSIEGVSDVGIKNGPSEGLYVSKGAVKDTVESMNRHVRIVFIDKKSLLGLLPEKDSALLKRFHTGENIALPCCGYRSAKLSGEALLKDSDGNTLIIKGDGFIWSGLDIGQSLAELLTEEYIYDEAAHKDIISNKLAKRLYHMAPSFIRQAAQIAYYKKLDRSLEEKRKADNFTTDYPIDLAGWVLIKLLSALINRLNGYSLKIGKWQYPFNGAFVMTHDIEPSEFSYKEGLKSLLDNIRSDEDSRHMIDLVAYNASETLAGKDIISDINRYEIMSHGYYHDGELPFLGYTKIKERVAGSKARLEEIFNKKVESFRSPRYERSPEIIKAIEESGYSVSSTSPDTDRGNTLMYGGGVSINYPFYRLIKDAGEYRKSNLLEVPVTSPDCIEPLMMGMGKDGMLDIYKKKLEYVEAIEGVYVSIVHAGNFGREDSDVRMSLLRFLSEEVKKHKFWLTNLKSLRAWWILRSGLSVSIANGGAITLSNGNDVEVKDIKVIYEEEGSGMKVYHAEKISPNSKINLN